ncbi:MAG: helix-turn-helix domain-containing protein [Prochloraceae cyanobacterium]
MTVASVIIRWKLNEIMARYRITGVDLAKELGVRVESVSNLRKSETIPRIGGERIQDLCVALSKLSKTKVRFSDLYEEIECC